jgi:hypothetical protein
LLKDKKFLADSAQSPAIRVALRALKDFAIPFHKNGQIIWRYYLVPETEFKSSEPEIKKIQEQKIIQTPEIKKIQEQQKELNIFDAKQVPTQTQTVQKSQKENSTMRGQAKEKSLKQEKTKTKKKKLSKAGDNFFNKVKEWMLRNSMEILDIENFSKNEIHLRIKDKGVEQLLVAYNKRKISDSDIIKASKKAKEMTEFIEAARNLSGIRKID